MSEDQEKKAKSVEFRVVSVFAEQRLVVARRLVSVDFKLGPCSRLGSTFVEHFDIPRKVRDDGTMDTDLFCFRLADRPDLSVFSIESTVLFYE